MFVNGESEKKYDTLFIIGQCERYR